MKKQTILPEQDMAANPVLNVRVQANAGTGKTFVLVQRLLRILFREPDLAKTGILCLTYTNAGAAEMRNRILAALREWANADDPEILRNITYGLPTTKDLAHAREIFYEFIDNQNILKIQTIHGFCEEILRRFPLEARVSPSWRLVSGGEHKRLLKDAFSELIRRADTRTQDAFDTIAGQISEHSLSDLMNLLTGQYRRFYNLNNREQFIETTRKILKLDAPEFYSHDLGEIDFDQYLTKELQPRKAMLKKEPELTIEVFKCQERRNNQDILKNTIAFFDLCSAFIKKYRELKNFRELLDFDDLLLKVRDLFANPAQMGWVLSQLDMQLRHILLDEAQDTSPEQWEILTALSNDFQIVGDRENPKSLFIVGDTKQSIYSFQGASPTAFADSIERMRRQIINAERQISEITLSQSFRSTAPILKVVDFVFNDVSISSLANFKNNPHKIFRVGQGGLVEFHPLQTADKGTGTNTETARKNYIKDIADKIEAILPEVSPSDIMVLVQRRNPFADLLIGELKKRNIPVVGSDRIILSEYIAVRDFMNLIRFCYDAADDYSLCCVLKSPLFGFSEKRIYDLCFKRGDASVYSRLPAAARDELEKIAAFAQVSGPYSFFSRVLNTANRREKIIAALGAPAIDPLEEFMTICLSYERTQIGSLRDFMQWFLEGESEIKREAETNSGVRLMTIHSSKGLEAPVVFLIDTIKNPKSANAMRLRIPTANLLWLGDSKKSAEFSAEENDDLQIRTQEYFRLLYVAMTRARDRLYIYGFKGQNESGVENSWHAKLSEILPKLSAPDKNGVIRVEEAGNTQKDKRTDGQKDSGAMPCNRLPEAELNLPDKVPHNCASRNLRNNKKAMERGTEIHREMQFASLDALPQSLAAEPVIKKLFSAGSRAEVPIAGMIGGHFLSMRIDRLFVSEDEAIFIDYKTDGDKLANRPHYENQMRNYAELLASALPARNISGYILWLKDWELEKII